MRVGIIAIQHESNTFVQTATTLDDFRHDVLACGEAVRQVFEGALHEVGGFFTGLNAAGIEAVPVFAARAVPGGPVAKETFDELISTMLKELEKADELDGLLVAPHGAGVCESVRDMDGYWLELVRQKIGNSIPMICTLDAHANVSQRMIDVCDATVVYRTNPHVDQFERGVEAANLMAQTVKGIVRPTQAVCLVPVAINIERQHTESQPCKSLIDSANKMLKIDRVLSNSIVLGFPYADVEEMGAGFVVVTDNDSELAAELVKKLGDELISRREEFVAQLIGIEQAIETASQLKGPVCLLDMGDNVGGGSSADGTLILHALRKRQDMKSCACLFDPQAAEQAIAAGVGAKLAQFSMGGKLDERLGPPFIADVEVVSVHDGLFSEDEVRHGGKTEYNMGPSAVVRTDFGATILLNSFRTPPFSLKQLTSCGIEPESFHVLIAKGVQAPLAAYSPVCPHSIRVNTAGPTSADMEHLTYQHRRKPLFPFERETTDACQN